MLKPHLKKVNGFWYVEKLGFSENLLGWQESYLRAEARAWCVFRNLTPPPRNSVDPKAFAESADAYAKA